VKHPLRFLLLPILTLPADAIEIRTYNATVHDRFIGFNTSSPAMNPNFLFDATKFTGVGWFATAGHKQPALISPRHFVWATHHLPVLSQNVKFLDANGVVVQRTVTAFTAIASDSSGDSDLSIATLNAAVPTTVTPFRYLNLANDPDYIPTNLMVFGFNPSGTGPRAGKGTLAGFAIADVDGGGPQGNTKLYHFDYNEVSGLADDSYLIVGDSGSPSFATVSGEPVLVGEHCTTNDTGSTIESYDAFIPNYATKLNTQMAPLGYRMRPANYTATTLSFTSATTPAVLSQAYPGSVTFTFENTGSQLTGNAEMTLAFAAAEAPASITATGWVVESTGSGSWSIRKATMAAGEEIAVTATWTAMPNVATMTVNATIQSDTATTTLNQPAFTLKPTYASWASGLPQTGQGDDPDADGLSNLLEYAFGGNGQSGVMLLSSGDSIRPQIFHQAGTITLTYPERSDAVVRGLSYQVETSTNLTALAGATTLPAGAVSSTQPYVPDVPGFVKRSISWPSDSAVRFARVKVELSE
jgi:hypothetical protein